MCNLLYSRLAKLIVFIALFSLPILARSQAAVGNWTFNNTLAGTAGTQNTVSAASLSPSIPSGAYNGGTVYFGEGGWPTGAINTNMYLEFTLTPNVGYTLNLSSIDLVLRRSTTGSPSGSGPRRWALRSSLDGFATDITTQTLTTSAPTVSVALGGIYNNLTSSITFRLYGYDVFINSGGLNRFVFDNITVRGLSILPVKISQLSGSIQNNTAAVQCAVTESGSLHQLELERSADGVHFDPIAADISVQSEKHIFYDHRLPGNGAKIYYRVKATQADGTIIYSNVIVLKSQQETGLKLKSILSSGNQVTVQINADAGGTAKLLISTVNGSTIHQQQITLSKGTQLYTINNAKQSTGVQILSIVQNGVVISRQFVRL
ncbi:MAG: hypothetical protein KF746_06645 [Chitinophagaceae bacterium]|nr:hypothetical protein [Chitinophagaceae bacterium]